jgi:hypothetical protein
MQIPRSFVITKWEKFLERPLTKEEKSLIKKVKQEIKNNNKIIDLANNANNYNLYIAKLTNYDGNCLFESLKFYNIFENIQEFKQVIANLLIYFQNINIFNNHMTIKELFEVTNEIKEVYSKKDKSFYYYNFHMMCYDLATEQESWSRINTHLVLCFLSKILGIKFHIISNTFDSITIIYDEQDNITEYTNIYLGHIDELHYVPLLIKEENKEYEILQENKYCKLFEKWMLDNIKKIDI